MVGNLKPHGKYSYTGDLDKVGGLPVLMKMLLSAGLLHGDCMTCTGKTVAENLEAVPHGLPPDQDVILPLEEPLAPPGQHMLIMRGSLAPKSCVLKISGKDIQEFKGPAKVYDGEVAGPLSLSLSLCLCLCLCLCLSLSVSLSLLQLTTRFSAASLLRGTSSSFDTRVRRAHPACPRCSAPAQRWWARASRPLWR